VFDELHARAREEAAREEKRRKRARDAFGALLREQREVTTATPWDAVRPRVADAPEFAAVRGLFRLSARPVVKLSMHACPQRQSLPCAR
jgi:hypothetical protein